MKIMFHIASSGDCWAPKVPKIDIVRCYPKGADGKEAFDEAAFRAQVKDCRAVQLASDDRGAVCAFAAILLSSLDAWVEDCDRNDGSNAAVSRAARTIRHRVHRGAVASVRLDLSNAAVLHKGRTFRTVRVRIRHTDNGTVAAERFDRDFALALADFCQCYSRRYVERGDPPLVFHPDAEALLAELRARTERSRRRDEVRAANLARFKCERHLNGFCSPCKFDCPHYARGKCVDIAGDEEPKEAKEAISQ